MTWCEFLLVFVFLKIIFYSFWMFLVCSFVLKVSSGFHVFCSFVGYSPIFQQSYVTMESSSHCQKGMEVTKITSR